jgi:hypothetical protein
MRNLKFMFVIALAGGLSGTANATIVATGMSTAADHVTPGRSGRFHFWWT